jgi:uncharacterized protein YjbI with pentapeptide repeats
MHLGRNSVIMRSILGPQAPTAWSVTAVNPIMVEVSTPIHLDDDNEFGDLPSVQQPLGTADNEIKRDDHARVDLDLCDGNIGACAPRPCSCPRHDAARQSRIPRNGLGGNDPRGRRGRPRRCNVPPPRRSTGKKLSGLDLSGLDFSGAILRGARLNKAKLRDAKLDRAILDQAWLVEADLSRASLRHANIFAAQMQRATLDGADLSGARVTANLTGARLVGALLTGANLSADMKNQSMGLMRAVLKSAGRDRQLGPRSMQE